MKGLGASLKLLFLPQNRSRFIDLKRTEIIVSHFALLTSKIIGNIKFTSQTFWVNKLLLIVHRLWAKST